MDTNLFQEEKRIKVNEIESMFDLSKFYNFDKSRKGVLFYEEFEDIVINANLKSPFIHVDECSLDVVVNKKTMDVKSILTSLRQPVRELSNPGGRIDAKKILAVIASFVENQLDGKLGNLNTNGAANYFGVFNLENGTELVAFVFWDSKNEYWVFNALDVAEYNVDPGFWILF